jgi:MFS family permease
MLHLRSQYFLAFGTLGAIVPFQPMLLHELGMSDWHLGLILATPGIAALIAPVMISHIADRHLSSRTLLTWGYSISALALVALYFLTSFWGVITLTLLINFLYAPAIALLDVVSLHALRHNLASPLTERDFPFIRRWGSVGFIAPAGLLFLLTHLLQLHAEVIYLIGAAISFGSALLAARLPPLKPEAADSPELPTVMAFRALCKAPLGPLTLALFIASIGVSMFYFIMPRYLQDLGLSMEVAGLIITLGVMWEIALLSIAPRVMERCGVRWTTIGGFGFTAIRFLLLAAAPSVAVAAATQIFHAPLILVLAVVLPVIFTRAATPEVRNSLMGLASAIYNGLSRIIGPPLAGVILSVSHGTDLEQLQDAFFVGAIFCIVGTAILALRFHPVPEQTRVG